MLEIYFIIKKKSSSTIHYPVTSAFLYAFFSSSPLDFKLKLKFAHKNGIENLQSYLAGES